MLEPYAQYCTRLKRTGKHRQLPEEALPDSGLSLNFSSNDYLGLSQRPEILLAATQAGEVHGVGATGSRLLSGNRFLFERFESRIAQDKGTESALVFNSGFQANISVLSSLLDSQVLKAKPLVFFDRLNHASLYQAVFLSGAELVRYKHMDCDDLSTCLARYAHDNRPKFIVTETIFGMDGDILLIDDMLALARTHRAFLYLDEAHAVGMIGKKGYGLSTTVSHDVPFLAMGTLSKALGGSGAYVACDALLKDYLINKAAGFIYSTAPSPLVVGAALKAWEMVPSFERERRALFDLADVLRSRLSAAGFNTGTSASHIIPLIIGKLDVLTQLNKKLQRAGITVSLVRPPTVPPLGARLRVALNVNHTAQDIARLIDVLTS